MIIFHMLGIITSLILFCWMYNIGAFRPYGDAPKDKTANLLCVMLAIIIWPVSVPAGVLFLMIRFLTMGK